MEERVTEEHQLEEVKKALNIEGSFQDNTIMLHMREVKEYLRDAGVSDRILDSERAVGILTRGVSDLWNYGSGDTSLSSYFKERAIQLALKSRAEEKKNGGIQAEQSV